MKDDSHMIPMACCTDVDQWSSEDQQLRIDSHEQVVELARGREAGQEEAIHERDILLEEEGEGGASPSAAVVVP